MKVTVPIVGTGVVNEGDGPSPATNSGAPPTAPPTETPAQPQRHSLHQVRMNAQQPQPEFRGEFDQHGRLKWFPVEASASGEGLDAEETADVSDSITGVGGDVPDGGVDVPPHPDAEVAPPTAQTFNALQQQIQNLTQTVNILAQAQLQGMQPPPSKPQAPTPPDPTQFDFYEPAQVAEFHKLNNAYIQATVRHEVNAALEPHGHALQDAQLTSQYNAVVFQHGQDANFKPTMEAALRLVAAFPNISIPDAYKHVASTQATSPRQTAAPSQSAKPAQRTMTREEAAQKAAQAKSLPASQGVSGTPEPGLPASLRGRTDTLGRIIYHNRMSGRAGRPIGN